MKTIIIIGLVGLLVFFMSEMNQGVKNESKIAPVQSRQKSPPVPSISANVPAQSNHKSVPVPSTSANVRHKSNREIAPASPYREKVADRQEDTFICDPTVRFICRPITKTKETNNECSSTIRPETAKIYYTGNPPTIWGYWDGTKVIAKGENPATFRHEPKEQYYAVITTEEIIEEEVLK